MTTEAPRQRSCAGGRQRRVYIGPFNKQNTRWFLKARTGLSEDHASRWADALEREAAKYVAEEDDLAVIRHPVFLDTLAKYIRGLPADSRATAADEFRLSRGDLFGEIVESC